MGLKDDDPDCRQITHPHPGPPLEGEGVTIHAIAGEEWGGRWIFP